MAQPMSTEELVALPPIVDVVTAGRAFGMGRDQARALARAGEFPCETLPLGERKKVTKAAIFAALRIGPDGSPLAPAAGKVA
jgi:hypothetical protein